MLACVVAAALAASPVPMKLASPGLSAVNVSKDVAQFYSNHVAQLLSLEGISVITASEIAQMIGLERQKELLGCNDAGSSCIAELANALGVDGVVTGSIGEFEGLTQINLKVVAASDGRTLAIYSGKAESQAAMLEALRVAAGSIAQQLMPKKVSGGARPFFWIPGVITVLGAGVGVGLLADVSAKVSQLRAGATGSSLGIGDATTLHANAALERNLAYVSFGVAGAAAIASVLVFVLGAPATVTPSIGAGGGGFVLQGTF